MGQLKLSKNGHNCYLFNFRKRFLVSFSGLVKLSLTFIGNCFVETEDYLMKFGVEKFHFLSSNFLEVGHLE